MSNQFSEKANQIHDLVLDECDVDYSSGMCENATHDTFLETIEANKDNKYLLYINYRDVYSINFVDSFEEIEKLITDSIFCGMESIVIFDLNKVKKIGHTYDSIHRAYSFRTKIDDSIPKIKLTVKMSIG